MDRASKICFLIDHIDPLGQGVYKDGDQIFFIPKTLPGETGQALVVKSKKNIHFCRLLTLENKSPIRSTPSCPHFENCPGCHFLHTDYQSELSFKEASFARMLSRLGTPPFSTVAAPARLGYRNRVQLHYSRKQKKLGYVQGKENRILPAPGCQIIRPELKREFDRIQTDWEKEAAKARRPKGHVELYLTKDEQVNVSWNKSYAEGGFTQVNEEMNNALISELSKSLELLKFESALDLFGGDGNLAKALPNTTQVSHIDIYPEDKGQNFHSHNLFDEGALEEFQVKNPQTNYDLFLIDPPRAGFRLINQWVEAFKPKYLAYVSCHPQTMVRDLRELKTPHRILETKMLDLFPSTFHFEAMTLIELQ